MIFSADRPPPLYVTLFVFAHIQEHSNGLYEVSVASFPQTPGFAGAFAEVSMRANMLFGATAPLLRMTLRA